MVIININFHFNSADSLTKRFHHKKLREARELHALGGQRAVVMYFKDTRAEEGLGFWGDESSLSGTEGADEVHNDAIWSSHGAMHTPRSVRLLSLRTSKSRC